MGFLLRFCDRAERCVYEWLYACIGRLHLFHLELSNLQQRNGVAVFHNIKKTLNKIFLRNYKQNTLKEKNYLNEKNFGKITQKNNKVIFNKYSNNIARIQKLDYL